MFLVYNFSNSNVNYSLQRMSEHIELMGQLSSVTVKFPRVSHDGTVLSDFAFVCEGHFVRMQLFPPGR